MKKRNLLLTLFLCIVLEGQSGWVQKASLPAAGRYAHVAFVVGGKVYAGLGCINAEQRIYSSQFFRYDPAQDAWQQLDDFPGGARFAPIAFALNGKGYIGLGYDAALNLRGDMWEFDPASEEWTRKADFPGDYRYGAATFIIGNRIYMAGGSMNQGNNYLHDLWCYDPATDTWTQKADMPTDHRTGAVAFTLGGKGYVGSGLLDTYSPMQDFYRYDPVADQWASIADLPANLAGAVAFVLGDTAYVGTGSDLYNSFRHFWSYSAGSGTWVSMTDPPASFMERCAGYAFSVGDTGYVLAGRSAPYNPYNYSGVMLNDLWAYGSCATPTAGYRYQVTDQLVEFTDTSSGALQYHWDFGDGSTSTDRNPVHSYPIANGYYKVCQTVSNNCGPDSVCKMIRITCPEPVSGFGYLVKGHTVDFTDTSVNATQYVWNFGDGSTSTEKNPVHTYANTNGYYLVCHEVINICGTDISCKAINISCTMPSARFVYSISYLDVQFNDSSFYGDLVSRLWDFGDTTYSSDPDPEHEYSTPAKYHVCLTITDSCGTDSTCQDIDLFLPLALQVTVVPSLTNDLMVQFTDETPGTTYWNWSFGDGNSSTEKNPSHLYEQYSTYEVCLTAGNYDHRGMKCESLSLLVNPALHGTNPLIIYPNPTDGIFYVRFYQVFSPARMRLFDQTGRVVWTRELSSTDPMSPVTVDLSTFPRSLWYFSVECGDYLKTWKIVLK
jgi:PKD repeat protein/N-acetylneuraminic acid mutarotase